MKIEQSQLLLSGRSSHFEEQIRIRQSSPPPAPARAQVQASAQATPEVASSEEPQGQLLLMLRIAEMMLGKKIHLMRGPGQSPPAAAVQASPQPQVQSVQVRVEAEQVRFQARGSVTTADGRQIEFKSDLALSRRFVEVIAQNEAPAGNKQDPLVLNFDGLGVRLREDQFAFDLNSDGQTEQVPLVATGSGVLFADRNGDGVANDGSELFGPRTGDGFSELAREDADGNAWIDESDPVFGELRVWFQGETDKVYTLAQLGVGAISTASVGTQFDLRTPENTLLGQIRASGVYLHENGQAGVISHVDLVV